MLVQCGVNLTGAKDDSLDFGGIGNGVGMFRIGDDPLEVRIAGEIFDRGAG